jgi:integrase/recombinase XerD
MDNELNDFRKHLCVYRGLNECTILGYVATLKRFLKTFSIDKTLHSQIEDCVANLRLKGFSYNHVVNTSLALERYSEFKNNPIKVGRPKKPKPLLKEVLTEAEIVRIIHATKTIREKAILATLAYSGIRNLELCKLKVSDVRLGENIIRIISGKGMKDRLCFISGECSQLLIEYLSKFPRNSEDYLFTTLVKNNRLATGDVRKILKLVRR